MQHHRKEDGQQSEDSGCFSSESEDECSVSDLSLSRPVPAQAQRIVPTTPPSCNGESSRKLAFRNSNAASDLLISAANKAGMDGIDRERIDAILLRESGNSIFMQRQRKMDDNTNRKIDEMKQRLDEVDNLSKNSNNNWRFVLERNTIDPLLHRYRERRRPISTCVVIDLDSFFISCHILHNPELADIPACVGGSSMISTSNYVARQYGVRAAMPGYLGSKLVSELSGGKESLTFVKSDFDLYKTKSLEVRAILEEYDPNLIMYSCDEAYMDIGPYLAVQLSGEIGELSHDSIKNFLSNSTHTKSECWYDKHSKDSIHEAAKSLLESIREKVRNVVGLTCSAGLSSNFLLAKIASDINKPNGQCFVGPSEEEILEFINPLPLRKVCGIGRVMEKTLRGVFKIETVKDLYTRRAEIHFLFKPATAHFLLKASIGYSDSKRHESVEDENGDTDEAINRKGISHERSFTPTASWSELCTNLEKISLSLVHDLRERSLKPRTLTLKVKLANFDIVTRATTRDIALFQHCNNSQSPQDLVDTVVRMLKEIKRERESCSPTNKGQSMNNSRSLFSVRLLGVRCSNFQLNEDHQQTLYKYQISQDLMKMNNYPICDNFSPKNPYVEPKICCAGAENKDKKESKDYYLKNEQPPAGPSSATKEIIGTPDTNSFDHGVQCPLCKKNFNSDDTGNALLNAHIDICLNATAVKQLTKEETVLADERALKKKCKLTDFFGS